jgi:hypothetical protein
MDPLLPAGSKSTRTEAKMAATETDPSFFLDEQDRAASLTPFALPGWGTASGGVGSE